MGILYYTRCYCSVLYFTLNPWYECYPVVEEEGPVLPSTEEELSDLEDDDDEPVSAAELLARREGYGGYEYEEEEEYF